MKSKYILYDKVIVNSPESRLKGAPGVVRGYKEEFFPEYKITDYLVHIANEGYLYFKEDELEAVRGDENSELFHGPKFSWHEIVFIRKNEFLSKKGVICGIGEKNDDGDEFYYGVIILDEDFYKEHADLYDKDESFDFDEEELEKTGEFMPEKEYDNRYYSGVSLRVGSDGQLRGITEGEDKLTDEEKAFLFRHQEGKD